MPVLRLRIRKKRPSYIASAVPTMVPIDQFLPIGTKEAIVVARLGLGLCRKLGRLLDAAVLLVHGFCQLAVLLAYGALPMALHLLGDVVHGDVLGEQGVVRYPEYPSGIERFGCVWRHLCHFGSV